MPDDPKAPGSPQAPDWRELADKVSQEKDPKRLMVLIRELCHKLDQRAAKIQKPRKD